MKRFLRMILAISLMAAMMATTVFAAGKVTPKVTVTSAAGEAGEQVKVTLSLADYPEANSIYVKILPLTEGLKLDEEQSKWLLEETTLEEIEDGKAVWGYDGSADVNGDILSLVFTVPTPAADQTDLDYKFECAVTVKHEDEVLDGDGVSTVATGIISVKKYATVSGAVSGVESTDAVTVELIAEGETTAAKTATVTGNSSYSFDRVEAGTYTIKATCEGYEDYSATVTVGENATTHDIALVAEIPAAPTEDLKINSATLTLTEDINVLYRTTVPSCYSDPYMVFTFNGEEYTVTKYTVDANGRYCFSFPGVTPQCMGDNISAALYADYYGTKYSTNIPNYSVRTYCKNQLNKNPGIAMKTLLSDLLTYGEKSQLYKNYKTSELVTAGLSLTPSTFTSLDSSYNKQILTGTDDPSVKWSSAGLVLANNMSMRFGLTTNNPENYTYEITINGRTTTYTAADLEANGTGKYYLYFRGIMATEFNMPVQAVIKQNGTQVGKTLTYSVNTYICKNQTMSDALGTLLKSIYNYGAAAANYAD